MGTDPGRIPEILALEMEPDGPRTKTSWPRQVRAKKSQDRPQVELLDTLTIHDRSGGLLKL